MTISFRLKLILVCTAIPLLGGFFSSILCGDISAVYHTLRLPDFAVPFWIVVPVWSILSLLQGIACAFIWQQPDSTARTQALTFYAVQLLFKLLQIQLFFGLEKYRLAFWLLCSVFVLTLLTVVSFALFDWWAGVLLVPYLLWLFYSMILTRAILSLNLF
ncbi:MAG: tryptophan-rich sensory protein [Anaerotruncus sp.]|nr:tryptophan-rich sensory protein [Anaerotruncus sp.]